MVKRVMTSVIPQKVCIGEEGRERIRRAREKRKNAPTFVGTCASLSHTHKYPPPQAYIKLLPDT